MDDQNVANHCTVAGLSFRCKRFLRQQLAWAAFGTVFLREGQAVHATPRVRHAE
jgi:hypothetical protein